MNKANTRFSVDARDRMLRGIDILNNAVIRVGGASEIEVKECKDRVDDAMHATRVALLRATKVLEKLKVQNDDQKVGVEIVRKAISAPARQIALNAGEDASVIVGKILESRYAAECRRMARHKRAAFRRAV